MNDPTEYPLTDWLRLVLKNAREEAGLTFRALDKAVDIEGGRAHRFETGKAGVSDLDAHVVGYARATGRSPSSLWQEALDLCSADPTGRKLQTAKRAAVIVRRRGTGS